MAKYFNVYWAVLLITGAFALLFRNDKKKFILSTAAVHLFVAGCRYEVMIDLQSYKRGYLSFATSGWFSDSIIAGGRNTLFYMINKLIANLSGNNFQVFMIILSAISIASISIIIYRYSESPLISYLMWSCFGFYSFSFYALKQALAMSFIMLSAIGLFERKRWFFYLMAVSAGFVHMPAFVFLPIYELCNLKKISSFLRFYIIVFGIVFLFRNQIVSIMTDVYYESEKYASISGFSVGGRTIMLLGLLVVGIFLCSFKNPKYRCIFIIMANAALLQMFSVYDNVFTRLADYFFQFIILYAPLILKQPSERADEIPIVNFNQRSRQLLAIGFCFLAILFYYKVTLSPEHIGEAGDVVTPFKFFWQ